MDCIVFFFVLRNGRLVPGTQLTAVIILIKGDSVLSMLTNAKVSARVNRHACPISVLWTIVLGLIKLVTLVKCQSSYVARRGHKLAIAIETISIVSATSRRVIPAANYSANTVESKPRASGYVKPANCIRTRLAIFRATKRYGKNGFFAIILTASSVIYGKQGIVIAEPIPSRALSLLALLCATLRRGLYFLPVHLIKRQRAFDTFGWCGETPHIGRFVCGSAHSR